MKGRVETRKRLETAKNLEEMVDTRKTSRRVGTPQNLKGRVDTRKQLGTAKTLKEMVNTRETSRRGWRIADSGPPQQVLVHFKPCEGESFQVVDTERPDADLRSMTLAALYMLQLGLRFPVLAATITHRQENRELQRFMSRSRTCSTPQLSRRNICGVVCKQSVATSGPFGVRCYSKSALRCKLWSAMHQGPPRSLVWMPRKPHSSISGRMASISVLNELHKEATDPAELQVLEAAGGRYVELLLPGDYVRLDDLHSMALVTGCKWRCTWTQVLANACRRLSSMLCMATRVGLLSQHISASAMASASHGCHGACTRACPVVAGPASHQSKA